MDLQFPLAGVNRGVGAQRQPPYSTPDAKNVFPRDVHDDRMRGGTRPGTNPCMEYFPWSTPGISHPIQFMNTVNYEDENGKTYFADSFDGGVISSEYTAVDWSGWDGDAPDAVKYLGTYMARVGYGDKKGVLIDTQTGFDASDYHVINILIVPYNGSHAGTYYVWTGLGGSNPVTTDGIELAFTITGETGAFSGTLRSYVGGVLDKSASLTSSSDGYCDAGWLSLHVGPTSSAYASWRDTQIGFIASSMPTNDNKIGFGATATQAEGQCLVGDIRHQYESGVKNWRTQIVLAKNRLVYREGFLSSLYLAPSGNQKITNTGHIESVERNQYLYIADHDIGQELTGNPSAIANDAPNWTLTDTVASQFTLDMERENWVCHISGATNNTSLNGVHRVVAYVNSDNLTLSRPSSSPATFTDTPGNLTYTLRPSPKVWDPDSGSSTPTLTAFISDETPNGLSHLGSVPEHCPLICVYSDRIVMAGYPPHVWYMSRQGVPGDWDYSADASDPGRAIAATFQDGGRVGEPITALIPFHDDYLLFGCLSSIYKLTGDPLYGGFLGPLTKEVGVLSSSSWCYGPSGEVYLLAKNGLYAIAPGAASFPILASSTSIPQGLKNVDPVVHKVSMCYDNINNGVHIYITPIFSDDTIREHFFFHLETTSFWPIDLPDLMQPTEILNYESTSGINSGLITGCKDGQIRQYRNHFVTDDGTAIDSYVVYGPLKGGKDGREGLMTSLETTLGEDSGDVDWEVFTNDSAEGVVNETTAAASGSWSAGLNAMNRPRIRGRWLSLKVSGASGELPWAMGGLLLNRRSVGKGRKG